MIIAGVAILYQGFCRAETPWAAMRARVLSVVRARAERIAQEALDACDDMGWDSEDDM